ncbi:hypothetical protein [Shinella zoogloeoides]|uniref:hypothetical protein n=1 Tax=Shinella zoogloeoides TaxID=352475 RepID=UPI002B292937|nr:Glutamine-binding periplasmic protein [Shinella zoogloeoides]
MPNVANSLLEFQAGHVDSVIYDYRTLAYFAQTDGADSARVLKQSVGDRFDVGIAFPKNSELVAGVNNTLQEIRADGRYHAIYKKCFGEA